MWLGEFHITQQGLEASQHLRFSQSTRTQELIDNWGEQKSISNIPLDDNVYMTSQFIAAKLLRNSHICLVPAISGGSDQTRHCTKTLPNRERKTNTNRGHFPL